MVNHQGDLDEKDKDAAPSEAGAELYFVRFERTSEITLCTYDGEDPLRADQHVIAVSRYGKDLGRVIGTRRPQGRSSGMSEIVRLAQPSEVETYTANRSREEEALEVFREKAAACHLPMKCLSVHILPAEPKILFFFSADGRVDFRELVKELVSVFHTRIELRQIGVRDEARLLGGIGVCGRVLCCHSFPEQMCTVSIKMAKEQNLSLGSMKVSGPCGRLMCCLAYEFDYYSCERRHFPRPGTEVTADGERYVVCDYNMISRKVVISRGDGGVQAVPLDSFRPGTGREAWSVTLPPENDEQEDGETH